MCVYVCVGGVVRAQMPKVPLVPGHAATSTAHAGERGSGSLRPGGGGACCRSAVWRCRRAGVCCLVVHIVYLARGPSAGSEGAGHLAWDTPPASAILHDERRMVNNMGCGTAVDRLGL